MLAMSQVLHRKNETWLSFETRRVRVHTMVYNRNLDVVSWIEATTSWTAGGFGMACCQKSKGGEGGWMQEKEGLEGLCKRKSREGLCKRKRGFDVRERAGRGYARERGGLIV